ASQLLYNISNHSACQELFEIFFIDIASPLILPTAVSVALKDMSATTMYILLHHCRFVNTFIKVFLKKF
ncbi:hypothetical protein, partial [Anaerovibrio slackiae]|uniref:hypothetical protein n=1 Tax=Anaerovibrio slackiae TaxID=2652309 RepID=UPI003863C21B